MASILCDILALVAVIALARLTFDIIEIHYQR